MITLTKEEPLRPNGSLWAVDDATGRIILSTFANARLNRYSFLFRPETDTQPDQEIKALVAQLVKELARQINKPASWVDAWDDHSGDLYTPTRARTTALWHRKDGYTIYEEPGQIARPQLSLGMTPRLSIAIKPAGLLQNSKGEKLKFFGNFRGFLAFGKLLPLETFTNSRARATMSAVANRSFTPSAEFLSWFEEQHLSLIYQEYDERGYFFIIVVVPQKLDIEALITQGLVNKISTEPMY